MSTPPTAPSAEANSLIEDFLDTTPKKSGMADEKIDQVQNILDTIPNAMNFEHIDGFFCALICGPEPVPFSEFLPHIFGGAEPAFKSPAESEEFMAILAEHWKQIADSLSRGASYYPFLYAGKDGNCAANDWADGFMFGVQLRESAWSDLLNDPRDESLLRPFIRLRQEITDLQEGKGYTINSEDRDALVQFVVSNMQLIYNYYAK